MHGSISDHKKWLNSDLIAIRQFQSQISYLTVSIHKANQELPALKRQIAHYEQHLPIWEKELGVQKISLTSHLAHLEKIRHKFGLLTKIDKMQQHLKRLNKELKNA